MQTDLPQGMIGAMGYRQRVCLKVGVSEGARYEIGLDLIKYFF